MFSILVANNQLVTLVRPKKYSLHPSGMVKTNIPYEHLLCGQTDFFMFSRHQTVTHLTYNGLVFSMEVE